MECKNCQRPLRTDYSFCSNCGARVVRNRLTFKNLWYDITERYFNMDNTFLRTLKHMFTQPELVVGGYIEGIRRKYLNPISYLGIALSLSGLSLYILRKNMHKINLDPFGSGNAEGTMKVVQATLDFSTFIFLLYIPIIAFAGWLIYNSKNHNLSEYSVTAIYTLAHFSIVSFFISAPVCILFPESYMSYSLVFIALMAIFVLYVIRRIHGKNLGLSFAFLMIFGIGFFGVSILINIILLLTGVVNFSDIIPSR